MRSYEIVITPCSICMYFSHQRGQTALIADVNHKDEVSAGSHQLLSAWHVPLCKTGPIGSGLCALSVATCMCLYLSLTCV